MYNARRYITQHLHESGTSSRATFVPRHAKHDALALDVGAAGVISDTFPHDQDRLQDASGWLISQKYNSTGVTRYY